MQNWRSVVDFLVLCGSFYVLLRWSARARALRFALSISALYAGSLLARDLNLIITSWVLQVAVLLAIASMLLVFQTEIRSALMRLDSRVLSWSRPAVPAPAAYSSVADAAFALADRNIGALIVLVRHDRIEELIEGGVPVRADVSASLLDAIFQKTSTLHDGAVVVDRGKLTLANVVLPLTHGRDVPFEFGTRHRAAMGLAERCDALVVVSSEERGTVTLMRGGNFREVGTPDALLELLRSPNESKPVSRWRQLGHMLVSNWRHKLAAVTMASVVWLGVAYSPGNIVRTVRVPVEFTNLRGGFDLRDQSATAIEAQLRGRTWIMDTTDFTHLVAQFDLRGATDGVHKFNVADADIELPPGITIEELKPRSLSVTIVRRAKGAPTGEGK